jgi:hypothetical protein
MPVMFFNATNFNQNLTSWCVSRIGSQPGNFANNSALIDANKPRWGTCPPPPARPVPALPPTDPPVMEPVEAPILAPQAITVIPPSSPPQQDALRPTSTINIAGPRSSESGGLTPGGVAGVIIGILCVLFLIILIVVLVLRRRRRRQHTSALP